MKTFQHRFVEFVPELLEKGVIYITVEYKSAVHQCACGCGEKVVTPLSPKFWKLTFDGASVSLHPSIGNWSFACRSHYWIKQNQVVWAEDWSEKKVEQNRRKDRKKSWFSKFKKKRK
ncbi:MAG: hypothetical protein EOO01_35835 [Chitinophagaceae bacterium]|nr:MAG: hypothetical protein EOO01_35835 [Chitinophagaceae bacterium]